MFGSIGPQEVLIVLIIALVVLGPKRLPEMARSLGKGVQEFTQAINEDDTVDVAKAACVGLPPAAPAPTAARAQDDLVAEAS